MGVIQVNQLKPGSTTHTELLGRAGEVLVHRNVKLTESVLGALVRRGISEVYTQEADEEIKRILSTKIVTLDEIELDAPAEEEEEIDSQILREQPAKALQDYEELRNVSRGKEGFNQILQTKKVREMETRIENTAQFPDRPIGEALIASTTEATARERTPEYKTSVASSYQVALDLTRTILNGLRDGSSFDGNAIARIVEEFVKTYVTDKNILLNISGIKSSSEDYIVHHSLNVCLLAINIAAAAGYSRRQVVEIGMGALLHDIGMMFIPQGIRTKRSDLTQSELYEVHKHPILGLHLIEKVGGMPDSVSYVGYQAHEREDGRGYPKGRSGRCLHYYARIVMIADVFEALSSPRSYRLAYNPYKAMEILLACVQKGLFKAELVRSFIDYTSLFPVGSLVRLNTNEIAKVVKANGKHHTRPMVSVLADPTGRPLPDSEIRQVDLSRQKDIRVVQAFDCERLDIDLMKGF